MSISDLLLQEGIGHHLRGDLESAEVCYLHARECDGAPCEISYLLAEIAFHRGQHQEAETLAKEALAESPEHANALLCLSRILLAQNRPEEAATTLKTLSRLIPTLPDAWEYLGMANQLCGRLEEAKEAFCRLVELAPNNASAWDLLAGLYLDCRQPQQAAKILEQALTLLPDHPELTQRLGDAYRQVGDTEAARDRYRNAIHLQRNGALAITEAITLPAFYHSCNHVLETRHAMEARLAELENEDFPPCPDPVAAGGKNNFYSVYQGFDDRPLQEQLARLWRRIYTPARMEPPPRPAGRQRIKVGFVSAHFRRHTIGDLFSGLIAGLPKEDFETIVFHLGEQRDDLTDWLASRVEAFFMPRSNDLRLLADRIAKEACDILIYPDIGMEPLTYFLAFNRLAPVQATSWGHPLTSGLDTIDYFISSDQQEPPDGQRYYTEKLIRLPVIPAYLTWEEPPAPEAVANWRERLGIHPKDRLCGIVQSLFKLHPEFDQVIANLLACNPNNYLILIADKKNRLAPALHQRLVPQLGNFSNRLQIVPYLGYDDYRSFLAALDICLDTQPFGGGKTVFDAVKTGTPVACIKGIRLAARSAQAIRQQFNLDWPLAISQADIAIKIKKKFLPHRQVNKKEIKAANERAIIAWANTIHFIAYRQDNQPAWYKLKEYQTDSSR